MIVRRNLLAAIVACALGFPLAATAHAEKLVVGTTLNNPPWENRKLDGVFEGFDIDLVTEIAKRMGDDLEIQDLAWPALFSATTSGRIDIAISSITITNDRLKSQSFTQGYYDSNMALVTTDGSSVKSTADLKGKTLAALTASTGEAWIKRKSAELGIKDYRTYNAQQDLLLDLAAGRIDGGIGDIASFQFAFAKMKGMRVAETLLTGDKLGIMMKKGSPLLDRVNAAMDEIKKDGTMAALHKKWLGSDAPADSSVNKVMPIPQSVD